MNLSKNLKKLLVLAIFLRILVSGLLFHPDIKTIAFQTSFLRNGVVDIYTYLTDNKQTLPLKEDFVYFPLTYLSLGGYNSLITSVLGGNFTAWLTDADSNSVVNSPNIFKYLVFLKLPLLLADIFIAFLLLNYFKDRKKGENAFTLWLFNPFTIILIYAFSNIDIYATLLTLIAFLYIKKNDLIRSSIFFGLAISFKLYPLLFLPFLFLKAKNLKQKLLVVGIPFSIFLITIIPFFSQNFVKSALISGLSTRIFSPSFEIGFGESIVAGVFLLSSLFVYSWIFEKKLKLLNYLFAFLLIIFSFSHFHISWLLWILPFLVILIIKNPKLAWPVFLWVTIAVAIPMFYSDRSMTLSLFRVYSNWYDLLPTLFVVIQKVYDPYGVQSILHSILAGLSVVVFAKVFKKKGNKYEI